VVADSTVGRPGGYAHHRSDQRQHRRAATRAPRREDRVVIPVPSSEPGDAMNAEERRSIGQVRAQASTADRRATRSSALVICSAVHVNDDSTASISARRARVALPHRPRVEMVVRPVTRYRSVLPRTNCTFGRSRRMSSVATGSGPERDEVTEDPPTLDARSHSVGDYGFQREP